MKISGIIAEYNPFHTGHQYHIEETRRQTGADYVVVVMSGDYVQRGEPAIANKYLRTRMALEGGADIVLELPVMYATASAEYFATAGVGILDALGCVDAISFGSEWANVSELEAVVQLLVEEPAEYQTFLKKYLESGMNFPKAREAALVACTGEERFGQILRTPNHILGIEYMKAIRRKNSAIKPYAVMREGNGFHEVGWDAASQQYPSATALRHLLQKETVTDAERAKVFAGVPFAGKELLEAIDRGDMATWDRLATFLDYTILMEGDSLDQYFGVDVELARRIQKNYVAGKTFAENIAQCHSKNNTDAALRRAFLHIILQIRKETFLQNAANLPIPYIRVLGLRKEAGKALAYLREHAKVPLIQKPVEARSLGMEDPIAKAIFETDLKSADLYEQIAAKNSGRPFVKEITKGPVIL